MGISALISGSSEPCMSGSLLALQRESALLRNRVGVLENEVSELRANLALALDQLEEHRAAVWRRAVLR